MNNLTPQELRDNLDQLYLYRSSYIVVILTLQIHKSHAIMDANAYTIALALLEMLLQDLDDVILEIEESING